LYYTKKDTSKTTANEIKPEVVQLLTAEKIKRDIINKGNYWMGKSGKTTI
jgi:hypothetical protein